MSANSFFVKISSGDFGLAKTYWLYWVPVLLAVNALMLIMPTTATLVIVAVAYTAYLIPVVIGVWRAANQYEGQKIWAILATISVVLGIIIIILMLIMFGTLIGVSGQAGLGM